MAQTNLNNLTYTVVLTICDGERHRRVEKSLGDTIMVTYVIKLVAAFIRSRVLRRNTRWPTRPDFGEAKRLARLSEDFKKLFAEAEGYVGFEKAYGGLIFGDAEDIACIRKMRARLALLGEGVCHA